MGRFPILLLLVGCRQLFGFEDPLAIDGGRGDPDVPDGCECSGTTPVCDDARICVACRADSQCDSGVCLDDGACASETEIAYVEPAGTGTLCSRAMPCPTLAIGLVTNRPIVKIAGATSETTNAVIENRSVQIVGGPGASITRPVGAEVVQIRQLASVKIRDLAIAGSGSHGIRINDGQVELIGVVIRDNDGRGLEQTGGSLLMSRCVVAGNRDGGAIIRGNATIRNSWFVRNGTVGGVLGGVRLEDATVEFEFNTVAHNLASGIDRTGIECNTGVQVRNTIIADNIVDPACTFEFSLFDGVPLPPGGTSRTGTAAFASSATLDYHIGPESDAIDAADPTSTLADDIDSDPRPFGAGRDIGADERRP